MPCWKKLGISLLVLPAAALAEVDPYSLSLEELMNVPVTISSRKPLSQRETPGIVTVITAEEISHSGARDLIDVLRRVPGMDFRVTVSNNIALGMRGHVGSDGRILLLMDGIELNEQRYGSAVLGKGFPVDSIARIEIIRGSALAMYGGTALLGVINIITKDATELNGAQVGTTLGLTSKTRSRESATVMLGKADGGPLKLTATAYLGRAARSDRTYQDVTGGTLDLTNVNAVHPEFLNLGLDVGNFSARFLHESSQVDDSDGAYTIRAADFKNFYNDDALKLQYRYQASEKLTLTPSLLYQQQTPRKTLRTNGSLFSKTSVQRIQAKLPLTWDNGTDWHFAAGLEHTHEEYSSEARPFPLKKLPFSATTVNSVYGEALWRNTWGDLTVSTRLDEHSQAGSLSSERLGYTRVRGKWHTKFMGSFAQRAPSMEGYATRPGVVKAETARTWEFETGYRTSPDSQVTLNLFDITTYDTLVLVNYNKVHTRGLEAEYKVRKEWGYADLSYSYYNAHGTNTVQVQPIDATTGLLVDDAVNLAFPAHKLTANVNYKLASGWSLNPSLVYLGSRWGYVAPDPGFTGGTLKHFAPTPLLNVVMRWENALARGLDLTFGLHNVLNENLDFISQTNSFHAPLPDMSRELVLQARYKF